ECGGTLSHGAVVAREMGLPAVVLPDATRLFQEGEAIHVDGRRGHVVRAADAKAQAQIASAEVDPQDVHVPRELIPPPPGRRERLAGRARNILALAWAVYLLAAFGLPEDWLYQRSLSAMDFFLWPMIRNWGKPSTVAALAAAVAALTMLVQRIATDNKRLLEAKRRAALLQGQSSKLPKDSPRRMAMTRLAAPVQFRTLMAAMVPVGLLLGPMVMTFVWLKERAAVDAWNATPDSTISVMAMVDSDYQGEVTLNVPAGLTTTEKLTKKPEPVKKTLQRLLALYNTQSAAPGEEWELKLAPDYGRLTAAADLKAYLDAGVPPQPVSWNVISRKKQRGRYFLSVSAEKGPPVALNAVLGDKFPPSPKVAEGWKSPIREMKVVYLAGNEHVEPVFLKPFARLDKWEHFRLAHRLAEWDIGWLLLYIAAYLPVLFLFRAALRIA
ncbi:MAG: pyruvate phosphate dikinase PEP/pyruvate-binding protein, partial [Phycisphaerales bacterium]|nr:pyruvate phosphate dikinase PEP/pyruvate-binding protein [Phycisphaerales bacterium]